MVKVEQCGSNVNLTIDYNRVEGGTEYNPQIHRIVLGSQVVIFIHFGYGHCLFDGDCL